MTEGRDWPTKNMIQLQSDLAVTFLWKQMFPKCFFPILCSSVQLNLIQVDWLIYLLRQKKESLWKVKKKTNQYPPPPVFGFCFQRC